MVYSGGAVPAGRPAVTAELKTLHTQKSDIPANLGCESRALSAKLCTLSEALHSQRSPRTLSEALHSQRSPRTLSEALHSQRSACTLSEVPTAA
jgi:hypothetical protein